MNLFLLPHLLRNAARKYPDRKAVVHKEQSISYSALERKSNQLARALLRLNVKKGDRVGILLTKSIESIISVFGILKTGAAYVPLDPMAPVERLSFILSDCGIRNLIVSANKVKALAGGLSKESVLTTCLIPEGAVTEELSSLRQLDCISWQDIFADESDDHSMAEINDTYPAYILYTSGSTGTPKGVVISHLNARTWVNVTADFFEISCTDVLSAHPPLHFDMSVFDIFVAIKCGATIVLIPEIYSVFPLKLTECIIENQITVWNSVPTVLSLLAERINLDQFRFETLRLVLFAGAILPVKHLRKLIKSAPNAAFFNVYGQTEANSSTYFRIDEVPDDDSWRIPIGRQFPNFDVFAIDDDNKIIDAPGEEGEIYIRSATVASGYWQNPERTEANFVTDPMQPFSTNKVYKTGDLVKLDQNNDYVFIGRKDHLVKHRGYRIEIDEIEVALYSHPGIRQAAAVTIPDDVVGNRIIAYVAPEDGKQLETGDILHCCSQRMPRYMLPEIVECRQNLPTTSTGKIDRNNLMQRAADSYGKGNYEKKAI